jgi:glyoxylate/hydroxypyruvate reductase A
MGLGVIGSVIARDISASGYPVGAWIRHPRSVEGVETFDGRKRFHEFLARSRVVINALPLTPETQNILDARAFAAMPKGGYVVNIGRGGHVVDDDLVASLDAGHLGGAMLDVFREEPLPARHPFWCHPKIVVTPHTAAPTIVAAAEAQVIENIRRLERDEPPLGVVDRKKGY